MFARYAAALLTTATVLTAVIASAVRAENLQIHGVAFPVPQVVEVGGGLVEVALPTGRKLVSVDNLEELVVSTFLGKSGDSLPSLAKQFSPHELSLLAQNAAKSKSSETASRAIFALLYRLPPASKALNDLIIRISEVSRDAAADIFAPLLSQKFVWEKFPAAGIKMLTGTNLLLKRGLVEKIVPLLKELPNQVRTEIEGSFFIKVLTKEYEAAEALLLLLDADTGKGPHVRTLEAILSGAQNSVSAEGALVAVITAAQKDAGVWKRIRLEIAERLPLAIEELIEQGQRKRAFELISASRFQDRTPRLHGVVLKALQAVTHDAKNFELTPQLNLILQKFTENDGEIRRVFIEVLKNKILYFIEQREVAQLGVYWEYLLAINPDPSPVNKELRYHLARTFIIEPLPGTAELVERAMQKLSFVDRVHLKLLKLYNAFPFVETLLTLLFILLGVALLQLRWRSSLRREKAKTLGANPSGAELGGSFAEEEPSRRISRFAAGGTRRTQDPRVAEYDTCLEVLQLERGASLKRIKSTYRSLVKTQHPDMLAGGGGTTSTEAFMRLKEAYERLLQLENDETFAPIKSGLASKTKE